MIVTLLDDDDDDDDDEYGSGSHEPRTAFTANLLGTCSSYRLKTMIIITISVCYNVPCC